MRPTSTPRRTLASAIGGAIARGEEVRIEPDVICDDHDGGIVVHCRDGFVAIESGSPMNGRGRVRHTATLASAERFLAGTH